MGGKSLSKRIRGDLKNQGGYSGHLVKILSQFIVFKIVTMTSAVEKCAENSHITFIFVWNLGDKCRIHAIPCLSLNTEIFSLSSHMLRKELQGTRCFLMKSYQTLCLLHQSIYLLSLFGKNMAHIF